MPILFDILLGNLLLFCHLLIIIDSKCILCLYIFHRLHIIHLVNDRLVKSLSHVMLNKLLNVILAFPSKNLLFRFSFFDDVKDALR